MKNHRSCVVVVAILAVTTVVSCRTRNSSDVKVYGGERISRKDLPAIVSLESTGLCTGTFVSPTTVITAAHCIRHPQGEFGPGPYERTVGTIGMEPTDGGGTVQSIKVIHHGYIGRALGTVPDFAAKPYLDLAVVIFPKNSSPEFFEVGDRSPEVGDHIVYVGFGNTDLKDQTGSTAGFKNFAENTLSKVNANGQLISSGATGIRHGDSGGPLLSGGKLIGVASQGGGDTIENASSIHISLFHPMSVELMNYAVSQGAEISGFKPTIDGSKP